MSRPTLSITSIIVAIAIFVGGCPPVFANDPPTAAEIEQYRLAWHQTRGSIYQIKLKGSTWSKWMPISSAEVAALAAIFKGRAYVHSNGWISTGEEPVNH